MTTSIDFNAPVIRIPGYESKYDFAGVSNSLVRIFEDYLEARILQQFHFWLWLKRGGVIIFGFKWIYKAIVKLMNEAIVGFSEYQVRKAIAALSEKGILVREQLHREHYGAVHALAAYNRQYYYRINYEALIQFIETQIQKPNLQIELPWHWRAENPETKGFVNTTDRVCDLHEPDLRVSQNTTDTTFKIHSSYIPPFAPPGGVVESETTNSISYSQPDSNNRIEQVQGNPQTDRQNTSKPQEVPFTDVITRPPGVEQKVNQKRVRVVSRPQLMGQKSVLKKPNQASAKAKVKVQAEDESRLKTAAHQEVNTKTNVPLSDTRDSAPSNSSRTRRKTPKGTKPLFDFGLAPWSSHSQFRKFYRTLIASPYVRRMAKNLEALVHRIVAELKQGVPHPFWDDFVAGRPIGSSTRQEWQMSDGSPHPDFIEYLAEKLIRGNNTQTREIAISEALRIAKDPEAARFFWKECKVSLVNAKARTERERALGVSNPVTPTWTHERVEPTIEEAAAASMEIKGIDQQATAAIEAARSPQAQLNSGDKLMTGSADKAEDMVVESTATADPWLSEKPQRQKSIRETVAEARGGIDRIPKVIRPQKVRGRRVDASSKLDLKDLNLAQIDKALADPVLNADLTVEYHCDFNEIYNEGKCLHSSHKIKPKPVKKKN